MADLDLDHIGRLWSRDGGMGNPRSEEDYSDEGCRVLARHAFRDVNDLLDLVRSLQSSLAMANEALAGSGRLLALATERAAEAERACVAEWARADRAEFLARLQQRVVDDKPILDRLAERDALGPSALAAALARYLEARQHTLSTAHLTGIDQLDAEVDYVVGEAEELRDAIRALCPGCLGGDHDASFENLQAVRFEIADVVLAATCLAGMLPGDVTVEACIAEKTEDDRGRG